jgi:tetratricopeptide (TPR) repeat protein
MVGFGYPSHFFISGRLKGEPVVTDNQQFGWRFFPPAVARTPRPAVFSPIKPLRTCRLFVFGESAAFGDPAPAFGLPRLLEVLLRNRYPQIRFEVINAAMTAINSHVILPIARNCASLDGDIWVIYMGNNEVVGPYGAGTVFGPQIPSLAVIRARMAFMSTKLGQLLDQVRRGVSGSEKDRQTWGGMELFTDQQITQDDPRMETVYRHFRQNLTDLLALASKRRIKAVVSNVASNLRDCSPFASRHRGGFGEPQNADWERLYAAGIKEETAGNLDAALETYRQAAQLDDRFADLQFRWARCLWAAGDFAAARAHFLLARDYDVLRFRADSRINAIISQVASNRLAQGILFADGAEALGQASPHGVPGRELFFEHVHLNLPGNYWLARSLAGQIETLLPTALIQGNGPPLPWPSVEECTRQLALTDLDRYEVLEILRQRLERAPFTGQLYHDEQFHDLEERVKGSRAALTPAALLAASAAYREASARAPDDWTLHELFARALERTGDRAKAGEQWRQVSALLPHYPEAHYRLSALLDPAAQAPEAISHLKTALRLKPHFPEALNALGRVLANQGQCPQAILLYQRALRLKPDFASALVNWGDALVRLGKKEEAKIRFRDALRLNPNHIEAGRRLGQLLNDSGQVNEAITEYTAALRLNPQDGLAHYYLGKALQSLGRFAEAQAHFAEAVQYSPDFAEAHSQLGFELAKQGKEAEAMSHFATALRLNPDLAEAHLNLGVAYAKQQKFPEAVAQFEEAVRCDPAHAAAREYLQAARKLQRKQP